MGEMTIKTYSITVDGFPPVLFSARTPAKARVACWRSYQHYDDRCDFKTFLGMSRIARVDNPPGIGRRVMVAGLPATTVLSNSGAHVSYVRDDSDVFFSAHESEIAEMPEGSKSAHKAGDGN